MILIVKLIANLLHSNAISGHQKLPACWVHSGWGVFSTMLKLFIRLTSITAVHLALNSHIPYSGKFSLGANFRDFRGQTCFRENKNCEKNESMTSLRAHVEYRCERDGSLQSVCPLNGCCKEESASYCTKYQQNHKRRSEDVASTGRGVVRASCVPRK